MGTGKRDGGRFGSKEVISSQILKTLSPIGHLCYFLYPFPGCQKPGPSMLLLKEPIPNWNHPAAPPGAGSCAGIAWWSLLYNRVSEFGLRKRNQQHISCSFLTGVIKGLECLWHGFPEGFSDFPLYSQTLLQEALTG